MDVASLFTDGKNGRHDIQHNGIQYDDTQHNGLNCDNQHNNTQHSVCYFECRHADCHYTDCRYSECHYAGCRGIKKGIINRFNNSCDVRGSFIRHRGCTKFQKILEENEKLKKNFFQKKSFSFKPNFFSKNFVE